MTEMHTKALIERMARYGYETGVASTADIYPVSKEWTWDNELEPCKELWRKIALGCFTIMVEHDENKSDLKAMYQSE